MLRASPSELALLKQNNPVLGEAFEKGLEEFAKVKTKSSVKRLLSVVLGSFAL